MNAANRAIDAFVRASLVVPQAVAFIAWVVVLIMLIQALPWLPGMGA